MAGELTIVVGGQAGSEGKGAVCAKLHSLREYDYAVRVGGPNAGHTVYDEMGNKFAFRQLPVAAVTDPGCMLVIAAGSEVDVGVLTDEIDNAEFHGHDVRNRLVVDRRATLLEAWHKDSEKTIRTGTTGKGIGGARAARAMRNAELVEDRLPEIKTMDTQDLLRAALSAGQDVMLEGTQGYWLGSHAGYYPHCTSGDCRAIDFMAAIGVAPREADVWVVLRTYPIRIAGESGPLEAETSWEDIGVEPEITTVTKKVRRVGEWNWDWAIEAVLANQPCKVALTFADYWWHTMADASSDAPIQRDLLSDGVRAKLYEMEIKLRADIAMLGTGPDTHLLLQPEGATVEA